MSRKTSLFGVALFSLLSTALPQAAKAVTLGYTSGAYNTPGDLGLDPVNNILALDLGSTGGSVVAGGVTFVGDNTSFQNNGGGNYTSSAATPSDADLNTIADSFVFKPNYTDNNAITYTVNGLTNGLTYRTQILFGGVNGNNGQQGTGSVTGSGVTITEGSDTLSYNNVPANTAAQFVNYTFVATGTSLAISLRNTNPAFDGTNDFSQFNINGFDVQLVPTPEPASAGLLMIGGLGVALARRVSKRRGRLLMSRNQMIGVFFLCTFVLLSGQTTKAAITIGTYTDVATLNLNAANTVQAEDAGGGPNTVGGVTFSATNTVFTAGGFTYSSANFGDSFLNSLSNSNALYFANVNAPSYATTLNGLSIGQTYNMKIILFDGDTGTTSSSSRGVSNILFNNNGNTENISYNYYNVVSGTPGTSGASGAFFANKGVKIDYLFTAGATSLGIVLTPEQEKYMIPSAFALETVATPEPTSASLVLLGCCGLSAGRRLVKRRNRS